jgi:hypothetical protein
MRAAVVGGVAYHAGKRRQQGMEREEEQEYRLQELEAQQAPPQQYAPPPPAPAAPAAISNEALAQLEQLAGLKERGVISEEEFEVQKRRLLGTA